MPRSTTMFRQESVWDWRRLLRVASTGELERSVCTSHSGVRSENCRALLATEAQRAQRTAKKGGTTPAVRRGTSALVENESANTVAKQHGLEVEHQPDLHIRVTQVGQHLRFVDTRELVDAFDVDNN